MTQATGVGDSAVMLRSTEYILNKVKLLISSNT